MGIEPHHPTKIKRSGLVFLLALLPGFFCIMGMGHFYLRRIGSGILILIVGLGAGMFLVGFFVFSGGFAVSIPLQLFFLAPYLALNIWQAYNAYKIAKNELRR
ncbi:MAG: hypothetical protein HMLIMOIP_000157 [Candidatus Nitrosomirales archaeon]|jgi:hypothetical protein